MKPELLNIINIQLVLQNPHLTVNKYFAHWNSVAAYSEDINKYYCQSQFQWDEEIKSNLMPPLSTVLATTLRPGIGISIGTE